MNGFGERLKKRISMVGVKQNHLAELIGVHQNTITRWIKEDRYPGIFEAYRLSHYLDCDLHWLVTGKLHPAYNPNYVTETGKFVVTEKKKDYTVVTKEKSEADLFEKFKTLKPEYKKTIEELIELYAKKET